MYIGYLTYFPKFEVEMLKTEEVMPILLNNAKIISMFDAGYFLISNEFCFKTQRQTLFPHLT